MKGVEKKLLIPASLGLLAFTARAVVGDDVFGGALEMDATDFDSSEPIADTDMPGIESLTSDTLESQLAELEAEAAAAQQTLDEFRYLAAPDDPDIIKLERAIAYYDAMEAHLKSVMDDVAQLDKLGGAGASTEAARFEDSIRDRLTAARSVDGLRFTNEDLKMVNEDCAVAHKFLEGAKPGHVIVSNGEVREWRRLSELIPVKPGTELDNLPASTCYAFWQYYQQIDDGIAGIPRVTEGSNITWQHMNGSAHDSGRAVDFGFINREYTPENIARALYGAGEIPFPTEAKVFYEITSGNLDAIQAKIAKVLVADYGMSPAEAARFVEERVIYNPDASGPHFHFEVAGPVIVGMK